MYARSVLFHSVAVVFLAALVTAAHAGAQQGHDAHPTSQDPHADMPFRRISTLATRRR